MANYVCPICGKKLIWGNDFDVEEGIASVYSCNECNITIYVVYNNDDVTEGSNNECY